LELEIMSTNRNVELPLYMLVRLMPEDFTRLDAQARRYSDPWDEAVESHVVRTAILKGLAVMEKEAEESPQG
jgi:hypothetical protein